MSEFKFHAPDEYRKNAWVKSMDEYDKTYKQSIENPDKFWSKMAQSFHWQQEWSQVRNYNGSISGHRMGTARVESALVSHKQVAEAAVIGFPHDIKGQGIYAFVTLRVRAIPSEELLNELKKHVRNEIGPIATPDIIHFVPVLPKTRSGKIMRRILRKIATDEFDSLGNIFTLADPDLVGNLIDNHTDLTG